MRVCLQVYHTVMRSPRFLVYTFLISEARGLAAEELVSR